MLSINNYKYKNWREKFLNKNIKIDDLYLSINWKEFINPIKYYDDYIKLEKFFNYSLKVSKENIDIFPYPDLVFNCFNYSEPSEIKVVILGQDPYFNFYKNYPQAMGLSFSIPKKVKIPSSLINIYKNLIKYKHIENIPEHGNLEFWAYQGVLLLNTSLTVQKGYPNSHTKKWIFFTDYIIKKLSEQYSNIVFVLWGSNSLKKYNFIDEYKHKIIVSSHPSGFSANKPLKNYPPFMNFDHFGEINKYLISNNKNPIIWNIV